MCGIFAILGNQNIKNIGLSGLKLLTNRGFDSCGVCYIEKNKLNVIKYASTFANNSIAMLENELLKTIIETPNNAIFHNRWATTGSPNDINSHPHNDNMDRISLVHNGIIENYKELKSELLEKGYFFKSQTDTEVISVLIGYYLDNKFEMEVAIKNTLEKIRGTWALVIINKDYPNKMWITRNGSPLLLGFEDDFIMVASEQIAFGNYIKKYIVLDNHDLIEITKENEIITYNKNIHRYSVKTKIETEIDLIPPNNYSHWMLKEIMEQPDTVIRALNNGGRIESNITVKLGGLDTCSQRLLELNHLILLGCGTSYNAGSWSLNIFKNLDIFDTVSIYDGSEFNYKDIPKKGKTGLIFLSQSGETKDLHRCIQIANDYDLVTIGVVNVVDSLIARETLCGVYLNAGREVAVASTKSFTNQCVVLSLIAVWFSQNKGTCIEKRKQIIKDVRNLSYQIQNVLNIFLIEDNNIKKISNKLKNTNVLFLLGKGCGEQIVKEGALKLKEVCYIHAEAFSTSSLKHGSIALIEKDLPVILLDFEDENHDKTNNAYNEIKARGGYIIKISNFEEHENDNILIVDKNKTFGGVLCNIYIQLLSYYIGVLKGNSVDYPKNLAKVVSVE
jgi:glucosamine--fructose-6-phosphate aminotransferase (isomerizing)